MFLGEYYNSIDDKNRMFVPSKHRDLLGGSCVITIGLDRCLYIYRVDDWKEKLNKYKELSEFDPEVRRFRREIAGKATLCELDKQGRIVIPQNLKAHARIEKELVTVGDADRVEVWAKEVYEGPMEDKLLSEEESFDKLIKYDNNGIQA